MNVTIQLPDRGLADHRPLHVRRIARQRRLRRLASSARRRLRLRLRLAAAGAAHPDGAAAYGGT